MDSSYIGHCTSGQDSLASVECNGNRSNARNSEEHLVTNDKHIKGMPASCIFVASLSKLLKDSDLCRSVAEHFSQWGTVLNVKVFRDWMQRPYGFVQFENVVDAQKALTEASGSILNGRCIRCEPARVNRTIYLGGMSHNTSKMDIQSLAENFGGVENITLIKLSSKQPATVNAFIRFHYRDEAVKAYLAIASNPPFNAMVIEWAANVNYPNDDGKDVSEECFSSILQVKNLPLHAKQEAIYNRFGQYGTVISVAVIGRKPYAARKKLGPNAHCYAYIHYKKQEEAIRAQENENGSSMQGHTLQVDLAQSSKPASSRIDNNKVQYRRQYHDREISFDSHLRHHTKILQNKKSYLKSQEEFKANGNPAQPIYKNHGAKKHHEKYVAESGATLPLYPVTNGFQAPDNFMQYPSGHANSVDYPGMYYSLPPIFPYCLDYGSGCYYNTGYGYNGPYYSVLPYPAAASVPSRHRH